MLESACKLEWVQKMPADRAKSPQKAGAIRMVLGGVRLWRSGVVGLRIFESSLF